MFDTERASAPARTGGCPCMGVGPAFTYTSNDNKHFTHYHALNLIDLTTCNVIILQKQSCDYAKVADGALVICFYDATTLVNV